MGTYTGLVSNITTPLSATISDATNATPIVIETSAPHLFQTGDLVSISGVGGNTAANCDPNNPWTIVVQDSTHFALTGSVGNSAYTSGGTAVDHALTPTLTEPVDGAGYTAASVKAMLEGLADRTQYLMQRANGAQRLINRYVKQATDDAWSSWSTNSSLSSAAWAALASGASPIFTFTNPSPTCFDGDVFEVTAAITAVTSGVPPVPLGLGVELNGGSMGIITGSAQEAPAAVDQVPLCLRGIYVVPGSTGHVPFNFSIMGYGNVGSPPGVNLIGHRTFIVSHWRSN